MINNNCYTEYIITKSGFRKKKKKNYCKPNTISLKSTNKNSQ